MGKIRSDYIRVGEFSCQFDIMYSAREKYFFVDVDKMFPGASQLWDMLDEKPASERDINIEKNYRGGMHKFITALSEDLLKDNIKKFITKYVNSGTESKKVILYYLTYKTETQGTERGLHNSYRGESNRFAMEFKYWIAIQKTLDGNVVYYNEETDSLMNGYEVKSAKVIDWTPELEKFIKEFCVAFDGLITKMKPFFEEEGKIIELIGRNILTQ